MHTCLLWMDVERMGTKWLNSQYHCSILLLAATFQYKCNVPQVCL